MALKNRTRLGAAIETNLFNELKELSENTRIPMSKLLDEAIIDLLKKHETPRS